MQLTKRRLYNALLIPYLNQIIEIMQNTREKADE